MATYIDNNEGSNTGWLYYKKYYSGPMVDETRITHTNRRIYGTEILEIPNEIKDHTIHAITTYPGLIMGTGYTHEHKGSDDAFKIGFFFDHSSGMPVITGSSVKGILRSAFPQRVVVPKKTTANQDEKESWIVAILQELCDIDGDVDIDELEREIFDGAYKTPDLEKVGEKNINYIPVYDRDIFFDAVPVEIVGNNIDQTKKLFGPDYITPHKNKDNRTELDQFSNPTPIKFLKILPRVKYEFRFKLGNSIVCPEITAEKKIVLFSELISMLGVGAKTNVGYGQFDVIT